MSNKKIPAPVIAVISNNLPEIETHASLDSLFHYADAPGDPPEGSKPVKSQAWLRLVNKKSEKPLEVLGRLIEGYMELPDIKEKSFNPNENNLLKLKHKFRDELISILKQCNLTYLKGGHITEGESISSMSLAEVIRTNNTPSIESEFKRALKNVNSEPREAVSAACNILEAVFKIYIEDEGLEMPKKQDLQSIWKIVRKHMNFAPSRLEDDDLKKILSGVFSIVNGVGSFRTHASSAHGQGRKSYRLKPRHARLAVNSAHTIVLFILETWAETKAKQGERNDYE